VLQAIAAAKCEPGGAAQRGAPQPGWLTVHHRLLQAHAVSADWTLQDAFALLSFREAFLLSSC